MKNVKCGDDFTSYSHHALQFLRHFWKLWQRRNNVD